MFGVDVFTFYSAVLQSPCLEDQFLALETEPVYQIKYFLVYASADPVEPDVPHPLPGKHCRQNSIHFDILGDSFTENDQRKVDLVPYTAHQYIIFQQFELHPSSPLPALLSRQLSRAIARGCAFGGG